ncbi:nitroreductase/quinone reductase family protein [Amycolatopsis solani]|uniref:nitroreductase/quinone reductase family protein n=1 Tax=Amycolatopsis solani TaxID=3028615 RepID=UPI0025B0EA09|nr:nitroreductase/quinone reductase family protein [Amycolatopsis sp. MEP2-6]
MSLSIRNSGPFWRLQRRAARLNTALFQATKGRVGATFRGAPVLLLDHAGRRSGTVRTTPLIYLDDRPDLVVVASKGGSDTHPAWYLNLLAMPVTEVELPGGVRREVRPRPASSAERAALWPRLVAVYPPYADYAGRTEREIPVVILEPAACTTQRAIVQHGYGAADTVLSVSAAHPVEPPSPTQVRIRVHAASVNPIDWQMIEGHRRLLVKRRFPYVPLFDLAGVVTAAGTEVTRLQVGDRVHADNKIHGGGAGEYVNVEQELVSTIPPGLGFAEAAALPLAAQTALLAIDKAGIGGGSRVVVIGASGGVGTYAVQMAKALGAHITAVSSARNAGFVRSLGADDVVDYTTGRFDAALPAGSVDAVLDFVGGRAQWLAARTVLARGGRFVTISRDEDDRITLGSGLRVGAAILVRQARSRFGRRIAYIPVFLDASRTLLDRVDRMVSAGELKVHIDRTYGPALPDVLAALHHSKTGRTVGKIVVAVAPADTA